MGRGQDQVQRRMRTGLASLVLCLGACGPAPDDAPSDTPVAPAAKPAHKGAVFNSATGTQSTTPMGMEQEAFAARMREGMRPGTTGRYPAFFSTRDRAHLVSTFEATISSQGFRERPFSVEKAPGTRRVLCLGNSVTFGTGIDAHERYSDQLEFLLEDASDDPVEVLNVGWFGMQSSTALRLLDPWVLQYQPDVVIVCILFNDHRKLVGETPSFRGDFSQRIHQLRARFTDHPVLKAYEENLAAVADSIRAHGAEVVFIEPASAIEFPLLPMFSDILERVSTARNVEVVRAEDGYRREMPSSAAVATLGEPGSWVYFFAIDGKSEPPVYGTGVQVPDWCAFYTDPFHPSALGHERIARELVDPVLRALARTPRMVE